MEIKTAYISKQGKGYKISDHFNLAEMASRDGSDKVLYSTDLMAMLEKLRAYGGFTIRINSGYRSPAYNRKIGGASKSQHTLGTAADIVVKKDGKRVSGKLICCLCQDLGFRGVALIKGSGYAVHVDMRSSGTYRGDENHGYSNNVGGDFYLYFGIKKSQVEALKATDAAGTQEEKAEANEMVYKTIDDVPSWYKEAVQHYIDIGATDGQNIAESTARALTIIDKADPFIKNLEDVPEWMFSMAKQWLADGVILGDGRYQIGKRRSQLETLAMVQRLLNIEK